MLTLTTKQNKTLEKFMEKEMLNDINDLIKHYEKMKNVLKEVHSIAIELHDIIP